MKHAQIITALIVGSVVLVGVWLLLLVNSNSSDTPASVTTQSGEVVEGVPELLARLFPETDYSNSLVEFDKVLSGNVGRDGIPAISEPRFDPVSAFDNRSQDILGVLIEIEGEERFYPYNILVSHEIVNDSIGETHFAVTFCPLCGSAIVFDRTIDDKIVEFGVSGFLFESNLIMYDRTSTPSLWSQARSEAIIGDQAGTALNILAFQLLTLGEIRTSYPNAKVLSEDTGFARNYDRNPYANYESSDDTIFPVSVDDNRFPTKEIFFIVPNTDRSTAIRIGGVEAGKTFTNQELDLSIRKLEGGELEVLNLTGEERPGYYEMWFSWAQHHQENGDVWVLE